jgi:hypothetical protein
VTDYPARLGGVRVDDNPGTLATAMGRGILHVTIDVGGQSVDLITAHLKSKLIHYPPVGHQTERFEPSDEGEHARYAAYAVFRRAAEAITLRGYADGVLPRPTTTDSRASAALRLSLSLAT